MEDIDALVVGAGVIGLAAARSLALAGRDVVVLESAEAIGTGTSSRNSEVIHAGIYYSPGSLKASLCVAGRERLYEFIAKRGIAHRRCGKLIVAAARGQEAQLEKLLAQAEANGVHDLAWLSQAELRNEEPALNGLLALRSPSTGIVDSHQLMLALQGDAEDHGAIIAFNAPVLRGCATAAGIELTIGGVARTSIRAQTVAPAPARISGNDQSGRRDQASTVPFAKHGIAASKRLRCELAAPEPRLLAALIRRKVFTFTMRVLATACLLALSLFAMADPFVVSDPVAVGVTQCGVYIDTAARVTAPVVAATGGNTCKYDLAGIPVGPHSVTMTAIAVDDPLWGSQESAQSSPLAFNLQAPVAMNYQGLWWVTGGTESGWGINFAHQGDAIFATWYTYDTSGNAWWLSMLANRTTPTGNTYTGTIYADSGPPFNNFTGSGMPSPVGNGTLTFSDATNGGFAYTVNMTTQAKAIARYDLFKGPQPVCTYSPTANLMLATNYQDLWWAASGIESGWGINFAHQGDSLFATWYTYDLDGTPLWFSALTRRVALSNVYTGSLLRTSGPRFDNYKMSDLNSPQNVGTATLTFANGNSATFNYATNDSGGLPAVNQTKSIVRFPFTATGGTVCQ